MTYVIANRDPGVHSWANPGGIRRGSLTAREQGFPPEFTDDVPVTTRRTKLIGPPERLYQNDRTASLKHQGRE